MTTPNQLTTALTALEVLEILEAEGEVGPSKLADRLDIARPTAYKYLATLVEGGYARNDDGVYRPSYKILGLGSRLKYRQTLFKVGQEPLRRLASKLEEPAFLGIEESGEWIVLHREGDVASLDLRTYSGLRLPLHTHAAGRVVLANMNPEQRDSMIMSQELEARTEKTTTNPKELATELDRIREQSYAITWDEQALGVGTAARPISAEGEFLGTVSIATLTSKMQDQDNQDRILGLLKEAAEETLLNYRHR
ncbi:IclR family transcriptional regulator [Halopenitus persicus]|uniref:IclR family transcriptional regulator n=1 Tax=Halopenitus persicus TaxID=1048396 RepID=UPI000BBAE451|nr:IclR family transcriptional regulator [Halopenitus persicus]